MGIADLFPDNNHSTNPTMLDDSPAPLDPHNQPHFLPLSSTAFFELQSPRALRVIGHINYHSSPPSSIVVIRSNAAERDRLDALRRRLSKEKLQKWLSHGVSHAMSVGYGHQRRVPSVSQGDNVEFPAWATPPAWVTVKKTSVGYALGVAHATQIPDSL